MNTFNLELAKAGNPVQTRDGRPARIICYDRKGNKPIVALIYEKEDNAEHHNFYFNDGTFLTSMNKSPEDLLMAPIKKEGWINIYKSVNSSYTEETDCWIYRTEKEAKDHIDDKERYILTKKIEWEELNLQTEKRESENAINNGFREIMRELKENEKRLLAEANEKGFDISWYHRCKKALDVSINSQK